MCQDDSRAMAEAAGCPATDAPEARGASLARRDDTILVWDWDDTLLCTTALGIDEMCPAELDELGAAVERCLRLSCCIGETWIVTNARETWVGKSSQRFLPGMTSALEHLQIMSARAAYEANYPGDTVAWKTAAFSEIFSRQRKSAVSGLNVVVLGDSEVECTAARLAVDCKRDTLKLVKFQDQPTVFELIGQLRVVERELAEVARKDASFGLMLEREAQLSRYHTYLERESDHVPEFKLMVLPPSEAPPCVSLLGG